MDGGDKDKLQMGEFLYNAYKYLGYQEQKITGANFDVPLPQLESQIDEWVRNGYISAETAKEEKVELSSDQAQNVIKEFVNNYGQVEMIYGLNGFIKLSEHTGANVFTYITFRINPIGASRKKRWIPPGLGQTLAQAAAIQNIDWDKVGQAFGEALFGTKQQQMDQMMEYIRYLALKNFHDQNADFLKNLAKEEEECREALPANAKNVNAKITNHRNTPLNRIFDHDPFRRPPYI